MIDAYDVLGLDLTCDEEDIKKAYRRMSLQNHPDKVLAQQGSGSARETRDATERFNEIKAAKEILSDPERRKIYDSFGIDLGEERPEMEVWNIGLNNMLSPLGGFLLKTIVLRACLWLIGWRWVSWLLILLGVVLAGLWYIDFRYGELHLRSEEALPLLFNAGLLDAVVVLNWIWPLLGETLGLFYLVIAEVTGVGIFEVFAENKKMGAGAVVLGFFVAWLLQGRWFWVIVLEIVLIVVLLISMTVAAGIMRLWLESVQSQNSDVLKKKRMDLRRARKQMETEISTLRKKLEEHEQRR